MANTDPSKGDVMQPIHGPNRLFTLARVCSAIFIAIVSSLASGSEQTDMNPRGKVLTGAAAFGDWHNDAPGVRRLITAQDLPEIGEEKQDYAEIVPRPAGAMPRVPEGFSVELVESGLAQARAMRVAPNGDLFVANSSENEVRVYRIPPGSAKPAVGETFATGLHQPYGMAFYPPGPNPQWIYIGNSNGVVRFPYKNGDLKATGKAERIIECILWTHHWTRDILFTPDGKRLLLAVGSGSNVALDMFPAPRVPGGLDEWNKTRPLGAAWDTEEGRANILSFNPDGSDQTTYATGIRNPSGITFQPATGQLWAAVNERDGLGDNTPFDYATHVQEVAFYGWPWFYIGGHEDPRHQGERTDLKDRVTVPDVFIQAHSSALQILFYDGQNFPAEYHGNAFVTLHGSWNRSALTGYKVVRLPFDKNGKPTGEYEDFMVGFVVSDKQVWGRPTGLAVATDGSLFVSEDGSGTIWRISHKSSGAR